MSKFGLLALLGVTSLLPGERNYSQPDVIYEEFIDQNMDGHVEIYVISTMRYPQKTRILISKGFADRVCDISKTNEDLIRINYNSKFAGNLKLVKAQIMDKKTQDATNERNKIAVLTNGIIITN